MKLPAWIKNIDKRKTLLLASKIGATLIALATIYLMYDQVRVMRHQSVLLIAQNQAAGDEFRNNLYFQKLNRRTHLLSVLYDLNVHTRIRKEALYEYMRIDKEVKEVEFRRAQHHGKDIYGELFDSTGALNWERLVTIEPRWKTDLTGVVLSHMNLEFVDFSNTVLDKADFSCSNLGSANFKSAELRNTRFIGSDLGGAHFERASATAADFTGARLNGAYLNSGWFEDAIFNMAFFLKTNIGEFKYTPKSAKLALVVDLYDYDESGGAREFSLWAVEAGAEKGISYEAWQDKLSQETAKNGITRPSNRPQKAPLVPRSAFCGG